MTATNYAPEDYWPQAQWARAIKRSALQEMLGLTANGDIISFALGLPALEFFPKHAFAQAVAEVLANDPRAMQYGPPPRCLKQHVVGLMRQRGVACKEDQVFLTTGAQQGMQLLVRLLLDPGGAILTEEVAYPGFQQIVEPYQPKIFTVPTDPKTGIDVDAVESLVAGGVRPSFIYAISDGHNPMGSSLSVEKRERLVQLAMKHRTPIIEDDAYGFISFDGAAAPPMRALDDRHVLYVGSFSKILAPSLRIGWILAPEAILGKLSIIKEASDIDTATFSQRAVSAFLNANDIAPHLALLGSEYKRRRDCMTAALNRHFPGEARWEQPNSGFFIWVELPERINATNLLKAAIEREKVSFIPGQAFHVGGNDYASNCLRLNFSNSEPNLIEEGISRLGRLIKTSLA